MKAMINKTLLAASLTLISLAAAPASAQPFGPGPQGTPVGSSMLGARIDGAPAPIARRRIPNVDIFGDEAGERLLGRDYDDSYLRPRIGRFERGTPTIEERATEGRSELNGVNAGVFARQGPRAIGASPVTRGRSSNRARIVFTNPRRVR